MKKNKRRFGDRYDGRYIRKADPIYRIIPYIMKERSDAQVFYEDRIYLDKVDELLKEIRKETDLEIGIMHVLVAAIVRTISQKPRINRFVSGRKIYARNEISFSLVVKKEMNEKTPETTIKIWFDPNDTLYDVTRKINEEILKNKNVQASNDTDKLAKLIMYMPGIFIKAFVSFVNFLDHRGLMPKIINKLSPFHSSFFLTNLGSIGIQPVYHHIYNFGTISLFLAMGIKNTEYQVNKHGDVIKRRYVNIKTVSDERVCDGYYYATSVRMMKRLMENPQSLLTKPREVFEDDEV